MVGVVFLQNKDHADAVINVSTIILCPSYTLFVCKDPNYPTPASDLQQKSRNYDTQTSPRQCGRCAIKEKEIDKKKIASVRKMGRVLRISLHMTPIKGETTRPKTKNQNGKSTLDRQTRQKNQDELYRPRSRKKTLSIRYCLSWANAFFFHFRPEN